MVSTSTTIGEPLYTALADQLRRSIRRGEYGPGQLVGSEHALARQKNISRMTVRKACELLINEGLLVRRPGKGLYVRARDVRTRVIQVIVGNLCWEPCRQIARGVQEAAKPLGIEVQIYDAHGDAELDLQVVRRLPTGQACGAILISVHNRAFSEAVYGLRAAGFPFVLVDQRLHDIDVPSVTADNVSGGQQVGQVLVEHGHRRIGFVGNLSADTVRDRLAGFRDAIGDAGLAFGPSLLVDLPCADNDPFGDWSPHIEAGVRELMSRPNPPTALFCSCDAVARSAYVALAGMGLRVPQDISVVGYDNDPLGELLSPALTTVRMSFQDMGREAIDLLGKQLENPDATVEHRVLPVELVRRESVAALREPAAVR